MSWNWDAETQLRLMKANSKTDVSLNLTQVAGCQMQSLRSLRRLPQITSLEVYSISAGHWAYPFSSVLQEALDRFLTPAIVKVVQTAHRHEMWIFTPTMYPGKLTKSMSYVSSSRLRSAFKISQSDQRTHKYVDDRCNVPRPIRSLLHQALTSNLDAWAGATCAARIRETTKAPTLHGHTQTSIKAVKVVSDHIIFELFVIPGYRLF